MFLIILRKVVDGLPHHHDLSAVAGDVGKGPQGPRHGLRLQCYPTAPASIGMVGGHLDLVHRSVVHVQHKGMLKVCVGMEPEAILLRLDRVHHPHDVADLLREDNVGARCLPVNVVLGQRFVAHLIAQFFGG